MDCLVKLSWWLTGETRVLVGFLFLALLDDDGRRRTSDDFSLPWEG